MRQRYEQRLNHNQSFIPRERDVLFYYPAHQRSCSSRPRAQPNKRYTKRGPPKRNQTHTYKILRARYGTYIYALSGSLSVSYPTEPRRAEFGDGTDKTCRERAQRLFYEGKVESNRIESNQVKSISPNQIAEFFLFWLLLSSTTPNTKKRKSKDNTTFISHAGAPLYCMDMGDSRPSHPSKSCLPPHDQTFYTIDQHSTRNPRQFPTTLTPSKPRIVRGYNQHPRRV